MDQGNGSNFVANQFKRYFDELESANQGSLQDSVMVPQGSSFERVSKGSLEV